MITNNSLVNVSLNSFLAYMKLQDLTQNVTNSREAIILLIITINYSFILRYFLGSN